MNMQTDLGLWRRPPSSIIEEIVRLAGLLTGEWFTPNVPNDTRRDLLFQDALCLRKGGALAAFLVFTSLDGSIHITLMGVDPHYQRQGYGSLILNALFEHVKPLGFERVIAFTVPPQVKPAYSATLGFYQKHGFTIRKHYPELWENGALELVKILEP